MVKSPPRTRPRSVTTTCWLAVLFGVINLWRVFGLGRQRSLLLELNIAIDPGLLMLVALVWAALFWWVALTLFRRRPLARVAFVKLVAGHGLYQLAHMFFLQRPSVAQQGWPLGVILYAAVLLYSLWALYRPAARRYFAAAA